VRASAASALEALGNVRDSTQGVHAFTRVESQLLTGVAHLAPGDRTAAAAAAEAALAAAEPDRLIFRFTLTDASYACCATCPRI
jgi:LuxR family transcriptional regulator, maltose regulon positive regulatory protein